MKHVIHAKHRELNLKPTLLFNDMHAKFIIKVRMDSNYVTNTETRKSVSGIEVTLNGAYVVRRSAGQKIVTLSVAEAEIIAMTLGMQEMLHVMRFLECEGLCAEKKCVQKVIIKHPLTFATTGRSTAERNKWMSDIIFYES